MLSDYCFYKCWYKLLKYGFPQFEVSASLSLCALFCTLQTSLDSFVSHPSLDKHRQEMNVVLQWFTPYWKHLLSKKSIQSSFGFTCLLFSLALADMYLFIWPFPTSKTHLTMFVTCPLTGMLASEFHRSSFPEFFFQIYQLWMFCPSFSFLSLILSVLFCIFPFFA